MGVCVLAACFVLLLVAFLVLLLVAWVMLGVVAWLGCWVVAWLETVGGSVWAVAVHGRRPVVACGISVDTVGSV